MTQSKKLRGTSERLSTNNFGTWTKAASQTEAGTVLQVPVLVKTLLPRMLMTQMDPQMSEGPTRLRSACLILPPPPPTILRLEHPPSNISQNWQRSWASKEGRITSFTSFTTSPTWKNA